MCGAGVESCGSSKAAAAFELEREATGFVPKKNPKKNLRRTQEGARWNLGGGRMRWVQILHFPVKNLGGYPETRRGWRGGRGLRREARDDDDETR